MKVVCGTILSLSSLVLAGHVLTVDELTELSFSSARLRICNYYSEHQVLPSALSDVPERPDYDDRPVDGSGNPLLYEPQDDNSVVLRCIGGAHEPKRSMRFSMIDPKNENETFAMLTTFSVMAKIERFLQDWRKDHARMPATLPSISLLPNSSDTSSGGVDGWGKAISYVSQPNGVVLLVSRGKDGNQIFSVEFQVSANINVASTTQDNK